MNDNIDNASYFFKQIERKAPEFIDLLTADSDETFELAFDAILQKAVSDLETNKNNFATLGEVGLSAALAMGLTIPGLTVTQETNSNGHVDLTIEAQHCVPARKKLGEAKIYRGPAYHFDGLKQLLERYTTGREGRGLLIVYFRIDNIVGLVSNLRKEMNNAHPCNQQGVTSDHLLHWSFLSKHAHSSGETLEVGHIGCNLYIEEGAK